MVAMCCWFENTCLSQLNWYLHASFQIPFSLIWTKVDNLGVKNDG